MTDQKINTKNDKSPPSANFASIDIQPNEPIEPQKTIEISDDIKVEILLKAFDHTQTNYRFLFSRAQTIFAWVGSMFIAIIGANAIFGSSSVTSSTVGLQILITLAICCLFVFAWIMDIIIFKSQASEGKAAVRIGRLLHFFDPDFFDGKTNIFTEDGWSDWVNNPLRNVGISHGTSVLFVLAVIAIASIWL